VVTSAVITTSSAMIVSHDWADALSARRVSNNG
jgi:hypothetical protein